MLDDFRTGETTADRADFLVELRGFEPSVLRNRSAMIPSRPSQALYRSGPHRSSARTQTLGISTNDRKGRSLASAYSQALDDGGGKDA
jgi:hypothetical protein